jgi:hypothetical protein
MKFQASILSLCATITCATAHSDVFNYDDQAAWKDIVYDGPDTNDCGKDANSPINVPLNVASS